MWYQLMIVMKKNLIFLPLFLIFKYFCIVWGGVFLCMTRDSRHKFFLKKCRICGVQLADKGLGMGKWPGLLSFHPVRKKPAGIESRCPTVPVSLRQYSGVFRHLPDGLLPVLHKPVRLQGDGIAAKGEEPFLYGNPLGGGK